MTSDKTQETKTGQRGIDAGYQPGTRNIHELKWLFQLDDEPNLYLSNEKYPGWLGCMGDYTTHLYSDYDK